MANNDKISPPLDADAIEAQCKSRGHNVDVTVLQSVSSTSTWIMQESQSSAAALCAAEHQTSGRGRRGKTWHSPDTGVTFSIGIHSSRPVSWFGGLSLLTGAALCDCLRSVGATEARVKWPNDVLVDGAKLAGILIESTASTSGSATLMVIGIGINYQRGPEAQLIDQASTDLCQTVNSLPDRSDLIAEIACRVLQLVNDNVPEAIRLLSENWQQYDALAGRKLLIEYAGKRLTGEAAGIDETGALKVQTESGMQVLNSADITIQKR